MIFDPPKKLGNWPKSRSWNWLVHQDSSIQDHMKASFPALGSPSLRSKHKHFGDQQKVTAILQLLDHPTPHWRAVGNRGMIHDYEQSSVEVNHRKHQLLPPPPILAIPWTPLGRSGRGICQARPVLRGLVSAAYLQSTDPSRCWRCPRRAGLIVESLRKVGKSWKIYRPREHHFVSSQKKTHRKGFLQIFPPILRFNHGWKEKIRLKPFFLPFKYRGVLWIFLYFFPWLEIVGLCLQNVGCRLNQKGFGVRNQLPRSVAAECRRSKCENWSTNSSLKSHSRTDIWTKDYFIAVKIPVK